MAPNKSRTTNEIEIHFVGLQRSGNHAVISWLVRQVDDPAVFLNNVRHFEDPYANCRPVKMLNTVAMERIRNNPKSLDRLRAEEKRMLLISYENLSIGGLQRRTLVRREWVGESKAIYQILLLRDFFNWLASRVFLFEKKGTEGDLGHLVSSHVETWIAYAREIAGETRTTNAIAILFGPWCEDEDYRASILSGLGLPVKDNSRNQTASVGSSFDEHANAGDLDLEGRWRHLLTERYASVLGVVADHESEINQLNMLLFKKDFPFPRAEYDALVKVSKRSKTKREVSTLAGKQSVDETDRIEMRIKKNDQIARDLEAQIRVLKGRLELKALRSREDEEADDS